MAVRLYQNVQIDAIPSGMYLHPLWRIIPVSDPPTCRCRRLRKQPRAIYA